MDGTRRRKVRRGYPETLDTLLHQSQPRISYR